MLDDRFQVLNILAVELRRHGLEVSIDQDTICVGRTQWDEYSQRILTMLSAAPAIKAGPKSFFIFVTEEYDSAGSLAKYAVKLTDGGKRALRSWDLDTKRGPHTHDYTSGEKEPGHTPWSGSLEDVAAEMMDIMRML